MAHFVYPTGNPMAQSAPAAQAYQPAQGAYVAAAPQPTAYAATPVRAGQAYEGYPAAAAAAHPTTQYAYSRAQVAHAIKLLLLIYLVITVLLHSPTKKVQTC